ncbi:hypothetical protein LCGC14_2664900, partial [marine sediment metagenome]
MRITPPSRATGGSGVRLSGRGFTLVELLVVVGIIALLVTILMPSLNRALNLARVTICASNMGVVGRAVVMYVAETEPEDDKPWLYSNGHDMPWEGASGRNYDADGRLHPTSWGNPAIALTKDFGPRVTDGDDGFAPHNNPQNFLPSAEVFFCPAASYTYDKHYRRNGLRGLPLDSLP